MKSYLIGYDLNKAGQEYTTLINKIKTLGSWWHCLDSTWIIKSDLTAEQIRNAISPFIDRNDELIVVLLTGEAAWQGLSDDCSNWLTNYL